MNAKCRICRRKTDPEKMLLCDGCDRGHHMYCLKPKLKSVPQGDWYCSDCKPKERLRSPKKKTTRRVFSAEDEDGYDSEDVPLKSKAADTESEKSDSGEVISFQDFSVGRFLFARENLDLIVI
jgi:bromodomain adjacent to zinc finger domain protein 1A